MNDIWTWKVIKSTSKKNHVSKDALRSTLYMGKTLKYTDKPGIKAQSSTVSTDIMEVRSKPDRSSTVSTDIMEVRSKPDQKSTTKVLQSTSKKNHVSKDALRSTLYMGKSLKYTDKPVIKASTVSTDTIKVRTKVLQSTPKKTIVFNRLDKVRKEPSTFFNTTSYSLTSSRNNNQPTTSFPVNIILQKILLHLARLEKNLNERGSAKNSK